MKVFLCLFFVITSLAMAQETNMAISLSSDAIESLTSVKKELIAVLKAQLHMTERSMRSWRLPRCQFSDAIRISHLREDLKRALIEGNSKNVQDMNMEYADKILDIQSLSKQRIDYCLDNINSPLKALFYDSRYNSLNRFIIELIGMMPFEEQTYDCPSS